MRKSILATVLSICLVSLFGFTSCANAMANDGNNVRQYKSKHAGAGGGAVPFKTYNDIFDLQAWNTENGNPNGGGADPLKVGDALCNTQKDGSTWWGIGFVSNGAAPKPIYDMSQVKEISFDAKGSQPGTKFKVGVFNGYADNALVTMTTDWESYTVSVKPGSDKNVFLVWSSIPSEGGVTSPGDTFYIRNIAFYDASGNEIVPEVNE